MEVEFTPTKGWKFETQENGITIVVKNMFTRDSIIDLRNKIEELKSGDIPVGDYEEVARSYMDIVINLIDDMLNQDQPKP